MPPPSPTPPKVLIVDDNDLMRTLLRGILRGEHYQIIGETRNGALALEFIARTKPDIVFLDVMMPEMDGPTMAASIRETRPDIPVLFMSGYAEEQLRRDIDIENMHFIPKPFSVQQIARKVAEILGGRSA